LPTENPTPDYKYQFQLPSDFIRVDSTNPVSNYEIYEDKILSNNSALGLDYFREIRAELLPPYAIRYLEYEMASVLAIPLTVDSKKSELYAKLSAKQLQVAMSTDAQSQPPKGFASTPTTDVRYF